MLNIRKTTEADLPEVMPIFEEARATIAALGINQWQDGYPAESDSVEAKYAAIHRIAVKVAKRGSGISTAMMNYAVEQARANRKISVRVDTHYGNIVMRRMLEKHGFTACGTIFLRNGDQRVAYERLT